MMITIHGFPAKTKYQDVKILIKQECNINDFILDNLVSDTDGSKKVRIGLTDNSEGYRLMKSLDGYRMPGNFVLKAVPVGKTAPTPSQQGAFDSRPGYQNQPRNDYSAPPRNDYMSQPTNDYNNQGSHVPGGIHAPGGVHGPGGSNGPRPSHGHGGPHGQSGPHGHSGPGGPSSTLDTMNRPSPWAAGSSTSNQWNPNPGMVAQAPQNNFSYSSPQQNINPSFGHQHQGPPRPEVRPYNQGRALPEQSFGFTPKNNDVPPTRQVETRHALRSIETVDTTVTHPPIHSRYPPSQSYQQDKPDNFQGPTQYNINNPGGLSSSHSGGAGGHQSQYPPQAAPSPWQSQAQPAKPQFSKPSPTAYDKQYDDRKYIQPDGRDPKTQPMRPEIQDRSYKDYEKRRAFSPRRSPHGRRVSVERRVSPSGRRVSPPGRRVSPSGRRVSPSGRRVSPSGRRVSPHGRKFSPPGKRMSPKRRIPGQHPAAHHPGHHESPHKQASPMRRLVSPPRRPSPNRRASPGRRDSPSRQSRYSPDRLHPDKLDKYGQDKLKQVRPAYEPPSHASNQAMYSGGYRPDTHENAQYPMQGMRQTEQRNLPWQRDRDEGSGPMKKQDDDRRDMSRMQMGRDRLPDPVVEAKVTLTPQRKSRSPIRRERSPLRDRYKRHSPSPRSSRSPRRSWALEKRRSPEIRDAPPPPSWPGQNVRDSDYPRTSRPTFPERDQGDKGKHIPVWERPFEKVEEPRGRRPDNNERRPFIDDKIRPVKDLPVREPVPHPSLIERYPQREPKFSPREDYDAERRDNYRRRDTSPERKPQPHREDYELARRPREHEERQHPDDYHRGRQPSPRHDIRKEDPNNPNIDKDFEDIYKRALQFKKRAEELRRLGSKRRDDYLEDERSRSHHSEREREDNSRPQRYEDRHRFREEESLRPREREERPRDEHLREERPRHDPREDDVHRRSDYRSRDEYQQQSDRADDRPKRFTVSPSVRIKRDKAIEEIANKIIDRHENYRQLKGETRLRVIEQLKLAVARIVFEMFGDTDVSFIEIIIKYQAKYSIKEEEKILQDVMASLPIQFRTIKRQAPELSELSAKTARRSPSPKLKPESAPRPKLSDSRWNMNIVPPEVVTMPILGVQQAIPPVMNPTMVPMMVPAPFIHPYETLQPNPVYVPEPVQYQQPFSETSSSDEFYKLYLCKDDFDLITSRQADSLKDFLISQMLKETEVSQGWAPDFTLKGLQSSHRYELLTKDDSTRDWLVNLDFSEFTDFHVLVYTKEQLWFERAAVWLPGHSRSRNIEPLEKLKLQNKRLEGVNINKWKFVKKIVTQKGTRLYVDMPPSSARALEKHKMMLSYELQKVNVFLKAVAVDKDAFDAGLKEPAVVEAAEISAAIQNSPMPSLAYEHSLVKITLKGCKTLTLTQARKIKEVLIYHLFRYHQQDGSSKTDFIKYGFFPPNCFGIVPQNQESKKWLLSQHLGKVNRQAIVVLGGEDENTRFFKMTVVVPNEYQINPAIVAERLKQSNQGVKGINFNIWKPIKVTPDRKKAKFEVDIDLESLETMSTMKYQLDYVDLINTSHTAYFRSEYSQSKLEDLIHKSKAEMTDSYDIANMDLESDGSDNDIICLD